MELWFCRHILLKKTICLFNQCVDTALNFKEVYSVDTSSSVKYNKTLKALSLCLCIESR